MLWVYGRYEYFNSYSAGIYFRRQTLTPKVDPRVVSIKLYNIFRVVGAGWLLTKKSAKIIQHS